MKRPATQQPQHAVDWLPDATNEVKDTLADFARRFPDRVEMKDGKLRIKR